MELGTTLLIVIIVSVLLIIFASPWAKKIAAKRWFLPVVGIFVFCYVFFGRQLQYLVPEFRTGNPDIPQDVSLQLSRLLLLDLCPFFGIFGPIALLLKNKTTAKVMAPFGIFGACVTLFGQIIFQADAYSGNDAWKYIFVGFDNNQLYFMLHYLSLILGLMIVCWTTNWRWRELLYCHGFALFYFSYVLIIVALVPEILGNTTGILKADWIAGGEYSAVADFLKINTWPEVMIVGYVLSYIAIVLVFLVRYLIQYIAKKTGKWFCAQETKFINKFLKYLNNTKLIKWFNQKIKRKLR